jgi:hypothetical protein
MAVGSNGDIYLATMNRGMIKLQKKKSKLATVMI